MSLSSSPSREHDVDRRITTAPTETGQILIGGYVDTKLRIIRRAALDQKTRGRVRR